METGARAVRFRDRSELALDVVAAFVGVGLGRGAAGGVLARGTLPRMIWLLRHGDAFDPEPGQSDAERPLTDKGRAQATAAGAALRALGVEIDTCLASPRVRARDTAALACAELGIEVELEPVAAGRPLRPARARRGARRAGAAGRPRAGLLARGLRADGRARAAEEGRPRRLRAGAAAPLLRPAELRLIAR